MSQRLMSSACGPSSVPFPWVLGRSSGIQPHPHAAFPTPGVALAAGCPWGHPRVPALLPQSQSQRGAGGIPDSRHKPGQEPVPGLTQGPGARGAPTAPLCREFQPGVALEPLAPLPRPAHGCSHPKILLFPLSQGAAAAWVGGMWIPKQPPGEGRSKPGVTQRGSDTSPTPAFP